MMVTARTTSNQSTATTDNKDNDEDDNDNYDDDSSDKRDTATTCPVHQSTSSSPTLPINTHWRDVVAQADDGVVAIIDGVVAIIVRIGNRFRRHSVVSSSSLVVYVLGGVCVGWCVLGGVCVGWCVCWVVCVCV